MEPICEESDSEPLFIKQYSIVKQILENLPMRDLLNAAKVCKTWASVARIVRNQRKNSTVIGMYHPYQPHTELAVEYFSEDSRSPEAVQLVEHSSYPTSEEIIQDGNKDFLFAMHEYMEKLFSESFSESQLLLLIGTTAIFEYMKSENSKGHFFYQFMGSHCKSK